MGASEKILTSLAAQDSDMHLRIEPVAEFQREVNTGCEIYTIEVIFDGAVDETFDVETNKLSACIEAISADVSREYAIRDGTLGWSVEAYQYLPDETGRLWQPAGNDPVVQRQVAPSL